MNELCYNTQNRRIAEARTSQTFGRSWETALLWGGMLLIAVAVVNIIFVSRLAYLLIYPGVVCLMLAVWRRWRLGHLDDGNPVASGSSQLDELLTSNIVASIVDLPTAQQAWPLLLDTWQGRFMATRLGAPLYDSAQLVETDCLPMAGVFTKSLELSRIVGDSHITPGVLMAAILLTGTETSGMLSRLTLVEKDLVSVLSWQMRLSRDYMEDQERPAFGGVARDWSSGYTRVLDRFGTNMSRQIEQGYQRYSSNARPEVLDQMIGYLTRPTRNSVVLVGPLGSGRTQLVYALAERLLEGKQSGNLAYNHIISLDATKLISQLSSGGNIDELMGQVFRDAVGARNIVLFLDEAQLFLSDAAGSVDISQILSQTLEHTDLPVILAMTGADWHRYSTIQPALFGMVNKIELPDLSEQAVIDILTDLAIPLEASRHLTVTYPAIREAYQLSGRYVTDVAYPARAIHVLEDGLNHAEGTLVTRVSVQQAVEKMTGARVGVAGAEEKDKLLHLEVLIHQRMINQTHAVSAVAEALRRTRAGVRDPKRPVGSFLLLGPTGVGKTELARSLASVYYGGEDAMIRLDMSEYQQATDVARLLTAPSAAGHGSVLLRAVSAKPFSVVLLDELEKAHPDILNLLLALVDEGTLTDTEGKTVSFKEAIIIATSNAGADEIRERIARGEELEKFETEITDSLINSGSFKPELLNRFDDIVLFRPLKPEELTQVVRIMLIGLNKTLSTQNITVQLTDAAVAYIVEVGYDPRLGARPMRRALQHYVENTVSSRILSGEVLAGSVIDLDRQDLEKVATTS
jgi:ATP-dependent Clp protease ATP-binding subunit ClpC